MERITGDVKIPFTKANLRAVYGILLLILQDGDNQDVDLIAVMEKMAEKIKANEIADSVNELMSDVFVKSVEVSEKYAMAVVGEPIDDDSAVRYEQEFEYMQDLIMNIIF